jgi:hypothetical protein
MRYKPRYGAATLIAMVFSLHAEISQAEEAASAATPVPLREAKVSIGYTRYRLRDFNQAQAAEDNRRLKGGFDASIEFSPFTFKAAPNIPWIGGTTFSFPFGIEYSSGSVDKTHPNGTRVDWNLPLLGLYIAPEVACSAIPWLSVQPIGVGYYKLGDVLDANLTVSDRAGRLSFRSATVGALSGLTIKPFGKTGIFISAFYRWLSFTNVRQTPKDGYQYEVGGTFSPPGNLQYDLDFSGFVGKIGIARSF